MIIIINPKHYLFNKFKEKIIEIFPYDCVINNSFSNIYYDIFVETENNNILGFIVIDWYDNTAKQSSDVGHIMYIGIDKKYRNKKIGTVLLNHILDKYDNSFYLEVSTINKFAIKLYQNCGFEINKFLPYYYDHDGFGIGYSAYKMCYKMN